MFNLTNFTSALNDMGVKVLIPFDDFSVWLFKGKIRYNTYKTRNW